MKFKIAHTTAYKYSDEVFFEPHYLRFKPKSTVYNSIIDHHIEVEPQPIGFTEQLDVENNHIRLCWFDNTHQEMKIIVNSVIEVSEYNPLNFILYPKEFLQIPFTYDDRTQLLLQPALKKESITNDMVNYLEAILQKTSNRSIDFLIELNASIYKDFTAEYRETGEPLDIDFTFNEKRGSCRDLSWMHIHLLRHLGIAARFVSGYLYLESDEKPVFELHAWVEVYLPGAGWIGFDPTHGLVTSCYHIPLASSSFYENTMPVSGSIRGDATSILINDLEISIIP